MPVTAPKRKGTQGAVGAAGSTWTEKIVMYGFLAISAVVFLLPFAWLISGAFKTQAQIFAPTPTLIPPDPTLENFKTVLSDASLPRAFFNTTLIAVLHVALTLFLCSLAGMAFAKYRRAPGHGWLFAFVLGTMMIPGAVTMIPIFVILAKVGVLNTYWAMIIPGAANAFGIFWMRQYITANVPDSLHEAARIDGCSEFGVYWRIVVPVIQPALGALGVLVLISVWNNLMWAFIVLRTENMQTMPLLVYLLQGEYQTPYGLIMAAGLVTVAPLIVAFLLFQRAFISGVTSGAVKG